MGSWKGGGSLCIQLVMVLYHELPITGKQLPAFPHKVKLGFELWSQRWEASNTGYEKWVCVDSPVSDLALLYDLNGQLQGPRWQSGNTLASHLWGQGSVPSTVSTGKAGSGLPLVGSLQYRTLTNSMYWFPLPFQLPIVIRPVRCWKRHRTPNK